MAASSPARRVARAAVAALTAAARGVSALWFEVAVYLSVLRLRRRRRVAAAPPAEVTRALRGPHFRSRQAIQLRLGGDQVIAVVARRRTKDPPSARELRRWWTELLSIHAALTHEQSDITYRRITLPGCIQALYWRAGRQAVVAVDAQLPPDEAQAAVAAARRGYDGSATALLLPVGLLPSRWLTATPLKTKLAAAALTVAGGVSALGALMPFGDEPGRPSPPLWSQPSPTPTDRVPSPPPAPEPSPPPTGRATNKPGDEQTLMAVQRHQPQPPSATRTPDRDEGDGDEEAPGGGDTGRSPGSAEGGDPADGGGASDDHAEPPLDSNNSDDVACVDPPALNIDETLPSLRPSAPQPDRDTPALLPTN